MQDPSESSSNAEHSENDSSDSDSENVDKVGDLDLFNTKKQEERNKFEGKFN